LNIGKEVAKKDIKDLTIRKATSATEREFKKNKNGIVGSI